MSLRTTVCRRSAIVLAVSLLSHSATGQPLYDHDNGPLTGMFGIPDSTEGGILAPAGRSAWDAILQTASHSTEERGVNENLEFDGETTRFELRYRRGFGDRLELGIELPYVWHESGTFDSFIDDWHEWFGLPGGARNSQPQDELLFNYETTDGQQIDFSSNANGFGDLRLFGGWQLHNAPDHKVALRVGAKFATGDSAEFLGSGGFDYSVGIAGDVARVFDVDGLTAFYRLHGIGIGEPDFLSDSYRDFAGLLSFGMGYAFNDRIELRVQGALRSALYHAEVEPLGETSGTITFGGHIHFTDAFAMTIAVAEDIKVSSAPDVSFALGLRYSPSR